MMDDNKALKPTLKQSVADVTDTFRKALLKVSPYFGFIYFTLLLLGITTVVYITTITLQSTDIGQGTEANQKKSEYTIPFDQATISKLKSLTSQDGSPNIAIPSGRINPFSESVY